MAAEHWFRWHHGSVTDPKWRVIASRCVTTVTVGHVVTVWAAMLENASQASPRGELQGWDDEDIAALFGYSTEQVSAIREAMQGKVLDGARLLAWEKRQPNREDSSTERTRNWRKRKSDEKNDAKRNVTQCDAPERTVTLETETETEIKEIPSTVPADVLAEPVEPTKPKAKRPPTITDWLASLDGAIAIPADDPVYAYAERTGIPDDFLALSWASFKDAYTASGKRQRDFPATYRNAVKGNWYKLWWFDSANNGECRLTTAGEQARRAAA